MRSPAGKESLRGLAVGLLALACACGCSAPMSPEVPPAAPEMPGGVATPEICGDGVDNDNDGVVDNGCTIVSIDYGGPGSLDESTVRETSLRFTRTSATTDIAGSSLVAYFEVRSEWYFGPEYSRAPAHYGCDYVIETSLGQVTFDPNESEKLVTLSVFDDFLSELTEYFEIVLLPDPETDREPTYFVNPEADMLLVRVSDNDSSAEDPHVSFVDPEIRVDEGDSGSTFITVEVAVSRPPARAERWNGDLDPSHAHDDLIWVDYEVRAAGFDEVPDVDRRAVAGVDFVPCDSREALRGARIAAWPDRDHFGFDWPRDYNPGSESYVGGRSMGTGAGNLAFQTQPDDTIATVDGGTLHFSDAPLYPDCLFKTFVVEILGDEVPERDEVVLLRLVGSHGCQVLQTAIGGGLLDTCIVTIVDDDYEPE